MFNLRTQTINNNQDYLLAISLTINTRRMEFINVYAPNKTEAVKFRINDKLMKDSIMAGDFNAHHTAGYWDLTASRTGVIWDSRHAS